MKKLPFTILLLVVAIVSGCDSSPTTFEDSIPLATLTTQTVPEEGGTVHPAGGEFSSGDSVEIEARASEGYVFERWEGDLSGNSNPGSLVFNENKSVTAHFVQREYNLNIEISGEGSVRETVAERPSGEESDSLQTASTIQLTAVAEDGWFFDRWEGDLSGSENPETITVDGEKNVTAIFDREAADGYTITIEVEGDGTVERDPDRNYFVEGDEVILTAIPDPDWNFIEWRGDVTGTANSQTVTIEGDLVATAVFGPFEDPFLEIIQQPSTTEAGNPLTPAPEVKLLDEIGNPIDGAEIRVILNKNSFSSGSSTSVITDDNGLALFDDLIIETATTGYILTFETDEEDVSDVSSTPVEIIATDADPSSSFAEIPSEVSVGESVTITVTLKDEFGNIVKGAADDLSISVSGSNNATPSVKESDDGGYNAIYTPTQSGTDQITIEVNGNSLSDSPYSVDISGGVPAELVITQQPTNVTAGTVISPAPAVSIMDDFGNALGNIEVTAKINKNNFASGSSPSAETNSDGIATFDNLELHTADSGYSLTFQADELNKTSDTFDVIPAEADLSSSKAEVPDGVTGSETVITIMLEDQFGNIVTGEEDKLSVHIDGANTFSPSVYETNTPGTYAAGYVPVSRGTDQIDIVFDGTSIDGSPFSSSVNAAEASPSNSRATADPDILKSGDFSLITVDLRDNNGNPVGGLDDTDFRINVSGNASFGTITETSSPGTYEFDVTNNTAEQVVVSIVANGTTLSDSPEITFEPGNPHDIIIVIQPENSRSGETIGGPPTVRVLDEFGQEVPDVDVHVSEESGQSFSSGSLVVTTDQSGTAEFNDLVIQARNNWFNLVFSVEGVDDVISDRFRIIETGRPGGFFGN